MATSKKNARPAKTADTPVLTLRVHGPGVRSGRIAVPELIKICQEAQSAVNRQAEAIEGRKTQHPGPISQSIQTECTLELVGIGKGSTKLQFGLAKPQLPLPLGDSGSFGSKVVAELASSIKSLGNGNGKQIDAGVLQSLYALGGVMQSNRISEIDWITPRRGDQPRITGSLNKTVRERVTSRLSLPRKQFMAVDGVLEMADFKAKDRKCRIDPAVGASIMCTFNEIQESDVYRLLRHPVRIMGEGVFPPNSNRVESLRIESIAELPSLALGKGNFFGETSIQELANLQKVGPIEGRADLGGWFPAEEDIDEFLSEVYEARK